MESAPSSPKRLRASQPSPGSRGADSGRLALGAAGALSVILLGFAAHSVLGGKDDPEPVAARPTSRVTAYPLKDVPASYAEATRPNDAELIEAQEPEEDLSALPAARGQGQRNPAQPPHDPAAEAAREWRDEALRSPLVVPCNRQGRTQPWVDPTTLPSGPDLGQISGDAPNGTAAGYAAGIPEADRQNLQAEKLAFLQTGAYAGVLLEHPYLPPFSEHLVQAGTSIPAALITGINSDLPGDIVAQVIEPVFDTVTGNYLLVPAGAKLIGRYDSLIAFGQDRALMVWDRLLMPNGYSIQLDQLAGTDAAGQAGVADQVDFHYRRVALGVLLSAFVSIGAQVARGDRDEGDIRREAGDSVAGEVNRVSRSVVERYLNVQPTITIRPGWPVRVGVNRDVRLAPYDQF